MIETDPVPEPELPDFSWPPPVTDTDVLWLQAPQASPQKTAVHSPATAWVESQPAIVDISQPAILDIFQPAIVGIESHKLASSPALAISLSDVFSGQIPYGWQEVVAVVRQLADQLSDESESAPTNALPDLSRIALESTGQLRVRLAPNGLQPVARGLALMLHRLLTGSDAPVLLRLAVSQIVSGAVPIRSVSELSRELARLDAPRDPERLLALYQRAERVLATEAAPVRPPSRNAQVLPVVPPRTAHADEDADEDDDQLRTFRISPRLVPIASVLAFAAVLVGAAWFAVLTSPPEGGQSTAGLRPSDVAQDNGGMSLTEVRRSQNAPDTPRHQASRTKDAGLVSNGTLKTGGTSGATISSAPGPQASRPQIEQSTVALNRLTAAPSRDGYLQATIPVVETRTTSASRAGVAVEDRVYTRADEGVTRPVRIGAPLPDRLEPGWTENNAGVLELVIDPRGVVESAHLRSPGNRYRERWLVYAAKTWRFQPAVKDGQPVRFLERLAITETGPSEPQ